MSDPRNGDIFYVGATINSLKERLVGHCVPPRCYYKSGFSTKRHELIQNIISNGVKPIITLIEEVPFKLADNREREQYMALSLAGHNLIQDPSKFVYLIQQKKKLNKRARRMTTKPYMEKVLIEHEKRKQK